MQDALAKGCSTMVVLGDVFHDRNNVDVVVLDRAEELFDKITKFMDVYVLRGNHDSDRKGHGKHSTRIFSSRACVVSSPEVLTIGKKRCAFLPYTDDRALVLEAIEEFKRQRAHFLFAHIGVDGSVAGPASFEVPGHITLEDLQVSSFDAVAMGHYHKHQFLASGVCYVGSPLQHDWGDRGDRRGYVHMDELGTMKFYHNPRTPRFVRVDGISTEKPRPGLDYIREVVRSKREYEERIRTKSAKDAVVPVLEEDQSYDVRVEVSDKSDVDMLQALLDVNQDIPEDVNHEALLNTGLDLLHEAER